jgi:DNA-binding MarR family transcriptional regulator
MACSRSPRKRRQILMWLDAAEKRLTIRLNRALRGSNLPYAQFVVLDHLASLPDTPWTVTDLASALETGQPGVSKILRRLVAKHYVQIEPAPEDGRLKRHRLTQTGKTAYRQASSRIAPQAEDIFRNWQDDDIDSLHKLLYRLKSGLRRQAH